MLLNSAVATSIETFHPDRKAEFGEKTYWYQDFSVHVPFLGRSLIYRLGAKQCRFCLRSCQKHYRYMLDAHLIPAFGNRQLRELTREELQGFLRRKLKGGLSWETVHHFKCGLSKILGAAEEWGCINENLTQKT